jgi:hypothetical protein
MKTSQTSFKGAGPMSTVPPQSFKKNILPFILATVGEFTALFFWLYLFYKGEQHALALIILLAGFLTERLAVLYWVSQVFGAEVGITGSHKAWWQKLLGLLAITVSEIVVWVAWFYLDRYVGTIAGALVLIIGEQLQHSWDLALLNGKKIRDYIAHPTAIFITVLEAGGGMLMLHFFKSEGNYHFLIGGVIMLVALTIEHVVQGGLIHPQAAKVPA